MSTSRLSVRAPAVAAALAASAVLLVTIPAFAADLEGDTSRGHSYGQTYGGHPAPYRSGEAAQAYNDDDNGNGYNDGSEDTYGDRPDDQSSGNDDDDDNAAGDEDRRDGAENRDDGREHHSYKDDNGGDDQYGGARAHCVPGWRVKQRLIGEGWGGFKLADRGHGIASICATRVQTGRRFVLRIDGCSGRTLSSTPEFLRPMQPRRWSESRYVPQGRLSWRD